MITARTINLLPDFGSHTGDAGLSLRRFLGVLATFPVTASRWCRWCLRSKRRFAGGVALIFFFYEGLTSLGVFDWINGRVQKAYTTYDRIKGDLRDASNAWSEWITYRITPLAGVETKFQFVYW